MMEVEAVRDILSTHPIHSSLSTLHYSKECSKGDNAKLFIFWYLYTYYKRHTIGQAPLWQRSAHRWTPQANSFPHVSPQLGISWVQGSVWEVLPHGHVRNPLLGHGPHSPLWQIFWQRWWPQLCSLLHTWINIINQRLKQEVDLHTSRITTSFVMLWWRTVPYHNAILAEHIPGDEY